MIIFCPVFVPKCYQEPTKRVSSFPVSLKVILNTKHICITVGEQALITKAVWIIFIYNFADALFT